MIVQEARFLFSFSFFPLLFFFFFGLFCCSPYPGAGEDESKTVVANIGKELHETASKLFTICTRYFMSENYQRHVGSTREPPCSLSAITNRPPSSTWPPAREVSVDNQLLADRAVDAAREPCRSVSGRGLNGIPITSCLYFIIMYHSIFASSLRSTWAAKSVCSHVHCAEHDSSSGPRRAKRGGKEKEK